MKEAQFSEAELKFLITTVNENKNRLFGIGGVAATMNMKKTAWEAVAQKLSQHGGWPRRSDESIKKKWSNLVQITKKKLDLKNKSGEGAVNWTDIEEAVQNVLGRENPKLVAISCGFDSARSQQTTEHAVSECHSDNDSQSSSNSVTLQPIGQTDFGSTSSVRPSPNAVTPNRAVIQRKRMMRDTTASEHRIKLAKQLDEEHEWARQEHEKKMEILELKRLYYVALTNSTETPVTHTYPLHFNSM